MAKVSIITIKNFLKDKINLRTKFFKLYISLCINFFKVKFRKNYARSPSDMPVILNKKNKKKIKLLISSRILLQERENLMCNQLIYMLPNSH